MGSSAKKRKEKRKDFQKPKLKVGKARPKPTNFTDTSFNTKSVVLNQQFSGTVAPSASFQFAHHLSLLTSKTDNQRKDALNHITTAIATHVKNNTALPQPTRALIPKIMPLAKDATEAVRTQFLKCLQAIPTQEVIENIENISRYLRLALTHLAIAIRSSAADAMLYVLKVGTEDFVSCHGGWIQTLKCLVTVLGWNQSKSADGWTSYKMSQSPADIKTVPKYLHLLTMVLEIGLGEPNHSSPEHPKNWLASNLRDRHMIPRWSNPYGYLDLLGPTGSEDEQGFEDFEERRNIFNKRFRSIVENGLAHARMEGGEIGRAAVKADNAMTKHPARI